MDELQGVGKMFFAGRHQMVCIVCRHNSLFAFFRMLAKKRSERKGYGTSGWADVIHASQRKLCWIAKDASPTYGGPCPDCFIAGFQAIGWCHAPALQRVIATSACIGRIDSLLILVPVTHTIHSSRISASVRSRYLIRFSGSMTVE
jgi:hypothetical protein